ncbi:MAG: acetyl-CoA carboxylase, carboxyltransferase subunit beta [Coriobacteriia bacterium]|nr:acetyl-CoA carboxylase, carboxyltransferase subunit beta [Coriobacteriia bacterium]MBN2847033.1 acetyl-CoA carboxylase, carboxyltransferase subunit beta [Coriobacteriia bacterium]
MPINDWFKQREGRRYTVSGQGCAEPATDGVPDGVWRSCPQCKGTLYQGDVARCLSVCPHCGHHFELIARDRIEALVDPGTFAEIDGALTSADPLRFSAGKPYGTSLERACQTTGMTDAALTGRAALGGHPVVVGALDFRFVGASMGSVVGERIARAFDLARDERRGVVLLVASGGARMQEGMLSLMQMAKTSAAAGRLAGAGLPYVSVLVNPTYGGVTASFAVLSDVIFAEPGAMIGFAGPRLVEQTIRRSLPKGFQSAASLVEHGMIDDVVPRVELRRRVSTVLDYLMPAHASGADAASGTQGGEL